MWSWLPEGSSGVFTSSRHSVLSFKYFLFAKVHASMCATTHTTLCLVSVDLDQYYQFFCKLLKNQFSPRTSPQFISHLQTSLPSRQTPIYSQNCVLQSLPLHFIEMVIELEYLQLLLPISPFLDQHSDQKCWFISVTTAEKDFIFTDLLSCICLQSHTGQLEKQQQPKQNKTKQEKAQIKYARRSLR